jgi:hypothetical protein
MVNTKLMPSRAPMTMPPQSPAAGVLPATEAVAQNALAAGKSFSGRRE